jgi:hypothetical protein
MAASGFTPISLYYSTTASAVPTSGNLANGELGLNIADMKLYAKNSAGAVTLLASNAGASGSVTSVSGTGTVNGLTLTGTVTTSGSLTLGGTLSGTASININGTVGATTPTTGAFTTITASTSSSVGTTINEARIDINKSGSSYVELQASLFGINYNMPLVLQRQGGNVGIGTASPSSKLHLSGTSTTLTIQGTLGTGGTHTIGASGVNNTNLSIVGASQIYLTANSADRFIIGSAGQFGIGAGNSTGSSGQVLTSGGSGAAPTWTTVSSGAQAFVAFGSTGGY